MNKPHLPLSKLQQWMQAVLVRPLGHEETPYLLLPKAFQDNIEQVIMPSSRLSAQERLAIYQRGYLARLRHCMVEQFSALCYALGDELFRAFTDQYLQVYPSKSYTLTDLGTQFIVYLQATRPDKNAPPEEREDWPDFMIELVQLELAINTIFDMEAEEAKEYATEQTNDEHLYLVPCLTFFEFQFPTLAYYQVFKKGEQPNLPFPQKSYAIIIRRNFKMGAFHLHPAQFYFLQSFKKSGSIPEAQQQLANYLQVDLLEVKMTWKKWKKNWVQWGCFGVNAINQ